MVMKQNLLFICVALLVTLSGCGNSSKKSEVKEEEKPFSVVGERYAGFNYVSPLGDKKDVFRVYRFVDETNLEQVAREGSPQGEIITIKTGTYLLNYPHIFIDIDNGEYKYEGTFIDEKTFRIQYGNGAIKEFIKQ